MRVADEPRMRQEIRHADPRLPLQGRSKEAHSGLGQLVCRHQRIINVRVQLSGLEVV